VKLSWHSAEDGLVQILWPIGGSQDEDTNIGTAHQAIPLQHELGLHHGGGLVIATAAHPQKGFDFVNENDAGLDLLGQGKDGSGQLLP